MAKQYRLATLPDKFKLKIMSEEDGNITIIEAPLPETFGLTVGSEFTSPFDAQALAGVLQKFKIPGASNISRRMGVVTTKFYSNPEPTEISFDVEFKAEYSARYEVAEPALALMLMSLGDSFTADEVESTIVEIRDGLSDLTGGMVSKSNTDDSNGANNGTADTGGNSGWMDDTSQVMDFIGLIKGPATVRIKFGNLYELAPVWVSSVGVQFSNIVDAEGFPMSCICNVTAVIQRDPVRTDMLNFFHAGGDTQ